MDIMFLDFMLMDVMFYRLCAHERYIPWILCSWTLCSIDFVLMDVMFYRLCAHGRYVL
jgi:hypothetical protein